MTREDIKKEALDFSKRKYGEDYFYPMAKTQACCWGFVNGAEWRINSVWHDITEIPENNRELLCVTDHGCNVFGPNNTEFKEVVEYFHIKKWAYLEDLVPNTEDCV